MKVKKIVSLLTAVSMIFMIAAADIASAAENSKKTASECDTVKSVRCIAASPHALILDWNDVKGATGYELYRYNRAAKKFVKIKTTKKSKALNTKLKRSTKYAYRVVAVKKIEGKKKVIAMSKYRMANTTKRKVVFAKKASKKTTGKYRKIASGKDEYKILRRAISLLGCRYVAGGCSPSGFDCSGFVYYVYRTAGIKVGKYVPRTSCAQLSCVLAKKRVSVPRVGDIVLYHYGGRYSHAAIYAGKGKVIHATNYGIGVICTSLSWCGGSRSYYHLI